MKSPKTGNALYGCRIAIGVPEYLTRVLEHTADFDTLPLEQETDPASRIATAGVTKPTPKTETLPLAEVLSRYFAELDRTKALPVKTDGEKRNALALMSELTGGKPTADITKADAQEIKAVLLRLAKNRSKNPKTRDLPLIEMLEVSGVECIAARTMNVYLGHMQHFFGWAVNNGHAAGNAFQGLRLKRTARNNNGGGRHFQRINSAFCSRTYGPRQPTGAEGRPQVTRSYRHVHRYAA